MDITKIIELEPEVGHLLNVAKNNSTAKYQTRLEVFNYDIKPAIDRVVGYNSSKYELSNGYVYNIVLNEATKAIRI